ncbi:sensor histidine kinase [Streptomyces avicenniae]|uniref:sensor histidine kinase n=1 Tax=Streptomyces avicenniae TaxID=500153 RepID=UPI00069BF7A9|nr:sensor histidine kinase [Streptomyces avicenniae]
MITTLLRLPFQPRTLREGAHLALNLPLGIAGFTAAVTGLSVSLGLAVTFVGLPLMALVLVLMRSWGAFGRARARLLLGARIEEPEPLGERLRALRQRREGWLVVLSGTLRDGQAWRSTAHALLMMPWGVLTFTLMAIAWAGSLSLLTYPIWFWPLHASGEEGIGIGGDRNRWVWDGPAEMLLAVAIGLVMLLITAPLIRGAALAEREATTLLLGPSATAARVRELESDRTTVVDTSAADLRRIERDLHDGAQARLVALAMGLGMAKEKLGSDPEAAARMVDEAHGEVKLALQELRDLARGIHPAILTDRGLGPSLSVLAARCTVPVGVDVELSERPAEAIEGIAYFTVSELLQNVSKHSGGRRAEVEIWRADERLMIQVTDDGRGGADAAAGSGLAGLAERLAAVDGVLAVNSPLGGPTTVSAALPWRDRGAAAPRRG